ncbi:hypothetical protein [Goodfellowiella coeruleoviolacea]|uniref:hypothetical protein n=1 Tax=Goodfellowiella coeruleoviolacea TaxID=334858 RepID=UPI0020A46B90|nr:hypothetical protein [Goodfellowiella coeruleoviolacea]
MSRTTRDVLALAGLLAVLAAAGVVAMRALQSLPGPALRPQQQVAVLVDAAGEDGTLRLRTLHPVTVTSAGSSQQVPAGTVLETSVAVLAGDEAEPAPVAGSHLTCELRMSTPAGKPALVDVAGCQPADVNQNS